MGKSKSNRLLGISFGSEEVKLVEVEKGGKDYTVTALNDIHSESTLR